MERNQENQQESPFLFVGGRLCFDFVNTEIVSAGQRISLITNAESLRAWFAEAGLSGEGQEINQTPGEEWQEVLVTALALRTTLREMAQAVSEGKDVSPEVIATINGVLSQRRGVFQLHQNKETGTYCEQFRSEENTLIHRLVPIAQDAADLLCHGEYAFVRKCENPQCILFFYDTTKNHGRRWCSMAACGNRAKAAAHYRRQKQQVGS